MSGAMFWTELDVKHRDSHLLVVAKNDDQIEDLKSTSPLVRMHVVSMEILKKSAGKKSSNWPNISKDIVTALYATKQIIDIFPPELVMAMAENAVQNGIRIH